MKLAFLFVFLLGPLACADEQPSVSTFQLWSQSAEWLHLLHMQKTAWGFSSTVKTLGGSEPFFLSQNGATNPLAEIKETYAQMFEVSVEQQRQTQCRFLARRDFFARHSKVSLAQSMHACDFSTEWLKKLNTTKISLVFATGYLSSAASSFGHTFLKLQNPENTSGKELLDYGINFAARTANSQGALYALYGLLGYFPGTFGMSPYHQMIKEYTNLEGRDLWEYELDFSPEEVKRILWHLLELEGSYFDYYFLDDNCSFEILKLLEVGRPGLKLGEDDELFVIPLDTVKRAEKLITKRIYRPSLNTLWLKKNPELSRLQTDQILEPVHLENWSVETLSVGHLYYSLKAYENLEKYQKLVYEIAKERARRGKGEDSPATVTGEDPSHSHNSSSVQAGALQRQKELRFLWGFRFAFHDELSRDEGLTPWSHLEVGGFQFEKSQLRRYRILEMLSTEGVSAFSKPLSWGVSAGGDIDPLESDHVQNFISGKVGLSWGSRPSLWRWSNFLVLSAKQDREDKIQLIPGFESRVWYSWSERLRTLLQVQVERQAHLTESSWQVHQAVDLTRQLELRGGVRSGQIGEQKHNESQIFFQQNF